jgi:gluconate 2-dehydrogenase gamma chain
MSKGKSGRFFNAGKWRTMVAATSRIIPTDHDPGASEANVVAFIDRYLSGIDFIYANPYGSGFLRLARDEAEAWGGRIGRLQVRYRQGLAHLDELGVHWFGREFAELTEDQQDAVLVEISPSQAIPERFVLGQADSAARTHGTTGGHDTCRGYPAAQPGAQAAFLRQSAIDDNLGFFETLVLHTRQGFYADPAYGGNTDRVGWAVIGFPGPVSMAETTDGRFSTADYLDPATYTVALPEATTADPDADGRAG